MLRRGVSVALDRDAFNDNGWHTPAHRATAARKAQVRVAGRRGDAQEKGRVHPWIGLGAARHDTVAVVETRP